MHHIRIKTNGKQRTEVNEKKQKKILTYHSGSYAAAVLHDGLRVMTLKKTMCVGHL